MAGVAGLLLAAALAQAQPAPVTSSDSLAPSRIQAVEAAIAAAMSAQKIPGLSVSLVTGGEVFHRGAQQRVTSLLYTQPERGLAVVLFANLEGIGSAVFSLARQIAEFVDR